MSLTLNRTVDGTDTAVLFADTLDRELATFHLPGYLRPDHAYTRTVCGIETDEARTIPIRHAVRFARPCRRCLNIAGWLDLTEATPSPGITIAKETP